MNEAPLWARPHTEIHRLVSVSHRRKQRQIEKYIKIHAALAYGQRGLRRPQPLLWTFSLLPPCCLDFCLDAISVPVSCTWNTETQNKHKHKHWLTRTTKYILRTHNNTMSFSATTDTKSSKTSVNGFIHNIK